MKPMTKQMRLARLNQLLKLLTQAEVVADLLGLAATVRVQQAVADEIARQIIGHHKQYPTPVEESDEHSKAPQAHPERCGLRQPVPQEDGDGLPGGGALVLPYPGRLGRIGGPAGKPATSGADQPGGAEADR